MVCATVVFQLSLALPILRDFLQFADRHVYRKARSKRLILSCGPDDVALHGCSRPIPPYLYECALLHSITNQPVGKPSQPHAFGGRQKSFELPGESPYAGAAQIIVGLCFANELIRLGSNASAPSTGELFSDPDDFSNQWCSKVLNDRLVLRIGNLDLVSTTRFCTVHRGIGTPNEGVKRL